jgi:Cu2+-exporting ATPase
VEVPGRGLVRGGERLGSALHCGLAEAGGGGGSTLWYCAGSGAPPVAFSFADSLRPDAAEAVVALQKIGLRVEVLSGDLAPAVAAAAAAVGISDWQAEIAPEDKAARVVALQSEGRRVLMVGDGINDAGALAAAHASASPAGGTDLAQGVADLVLQGERLSALPEAIALARRAVRLSRQGIGFALAYNLVAVPAAVAGLVTPLGAAAVMATSSLAVIGNALRAGR